MPFPLNRSAALAIALGLTAAAAPAPLTISIAANNGAQSFAPNPATAVAGDSLVWRNDDFSVHRIVLDDGSLDTGNINPGTSSPPMTLTGAGGRYHCAIHPDMVGTLSATACTFTLAPTAAAVPSAASSGTVTVTAASGCAWTAASNSSFITITSFLTGNGFGTVTYSVAAHTTTAARTGSLTIAGQTFTVTQAAAAACPTIVVTPSTLPNVTQGVAANLTLTATGGTGPFVFAIVTGSLPAGLTLSSGGVFAGTPTAAGSSTFTVRATNASGCSGDTAFTLTVVAAVPTMPQAFLLVLAAGLIGLGWFRLARRRA